MLRSELNDALKSAMKTKDTCAVGTIRLILASIKDQDICARTDGDTDGISDDQVLALLNTMVKQRRESIRLYEQGGRLELAQREQAEIDVIRRFMPSQLEGESFQAAIQDAILEVDAKTIKDMGKTFGAIPGQFLRGPENLKECRIFAYFTLWANGPYSPGVGPFTNLPP